MFTAKNYVKAHSLEEAYELNQKKRNRLLGGMLWLKMGTGSYDTVIDLSDLGLSGITETEDRFEIGAMTVLRDLELHDGLSRYSQGAVREALREIVGVQFRNMATVGGSLYGRYGFSDVLTLFMAMDSYVELYKGGIVPLSEYAGRKYDRDILLKLIIKKTPGRFSYQSVRITRTDLPVLNCACSLMSGTCRAVLGARPGKAVVTEDSTGILKDGICEESAENFARFCTQQVRFGSNMRGSEAYRKHLARVLVSQNLMKLGGN